MPDAGGAQSGYLITHAGFTLLLDCGSGVFAKLRAFADPTAVDAVLISHLHADHVLDVLPFSFALASRLGGARRPPLWAPPGARGVFAAFAATLGMEDQINDGFTVNEYDPADQLELGPFTISLCEVPHYIPSWACDLRVDDGSRLTFGGDCGPNQALVELAQETGLMMLEATEGAGAHAGDGFRGHLTAGEAGELARRARARRLLLTHYSDSLELEELRAVAEAAFGGPVELAAERARYVI
jgi:ribonuclease BN (tRNA processing enzyme)